MLPKADGASRMNALTEPFSIDLSPLHPSDERFYELYRLDLAQTIL